MDTADIHTIVVGVLVIVLAAGCVEGFRRLVAWTAERISAEFREAIAEVVYELRPNGGNSAIDRVVSRIDGVGAEVADLTRKVDAHLASSAEYGAMFVAEGEKVLARLDKLEGKTTVTVNLPPTSTTS